MSFVDPGKIEKVISHSQLTRERYCSSMDTNEDSALFHIVTMVPVGVLNLEVDYMSTHGGTVKTIILIGTTLYVRELLHPTIAQPHFGLYQTLNEPLEIVKKNMEGFIKNKLGWLKTQGVQCTSLMRQALQH